MVSKHLMQISISPEQEIQLKELFAGLYFSRRCYYKIIDGKPSRIKARVKVKRDNRLRF
jgi:hypothetical protein